MSFESQITDRSGRGLPEGRRKWLRRVATTALSVGGHAAVILALLSTQPEPVRVVEPAPIEVSLVEAPRPAPPDPPGPAKAVATPVKTPKPPVITRRAPPKPWVKPLPAEAAPSPAPQLSDAQLAGASMAGSGTGGGGSGGDGGSCDMARLLQAALRKDPAVQAAMAEAHRAQGSRPVWVWNGRWIRNLDQEGHGLAVLREAMIWEIGFAPPACRSQSMRGLVLISLSEGAGSPKLAVGPGEWRWSDLLH